MASTSTTSGRTESEPANKSQGMAPSPSFPPSSSRSLFSWCFDWVCVFLSWCFGWVSVFLSWRSVESNSIASTSGTTGCIPENKVLGAFHELAPNASTSGASSIPIQKPSYDVFINHRGPDVKKGLAKRIYEILYNMKVTAFLDSEELEYGDFLPTTLERTIRVATLHIAIFSERYAESAWCLEELSLMLKSGAKIIPVFYHVEPTDLRYVAQTKGKYAAAFKKHQNKGRYSREKLQEWTDALNEVSFFIGEIIKNNDDEMRLLKNLVNTVLKKISNVPLIVAEHAVGLNKTVEDFENTLQFDNSEQSVQIVGIWGLGGSGKTTLAKELYNKRSSSMEKSCFIFDIREAKGVLQNKQTQLYKALRPDGNETFDNVEQGKAILARHLRSFKVLIVMDDVDHADQLDALVPAKESLARGSLIIVTTRERQVLRSWGISSIHKMKELDPFNAKKLFYWHAFLKDYPFDEPSPFDEFEELAEKFVEACGGLPLSLKVYGAQLYGNSSKKSWKSLLHKISRILPEDIKGKLRISYDALDPEEKEAFLDTACFFIGKENNLAIEVWDGSGWSGLHTWEKLLNKCLVELNNGNHIRMHEHLRDLGREIASEKLPYRLRLPQQIIDYGQQRQERNSIRGITAAPSETEEWSSYIEALAPSLSRLKLLEITGDYWYQIMGQVSRELVWLRWTNIGQRNLPAQISLKNLRVLELSQSHLEELWETESNAPVQLRELVISHCDKFERLPNSIGCLNELKKIVIRRCGNVRSLPEEFCQLQMLEHLDLQYCNIFSLPSNFGNLTNLRYLDLTDCSNLRRLPVTFNNLISLQYLNLGSCTELTLTSDDFQNITKLEVFKLSCKHLEELSRHITNQVSLRELYLFHLPKLREIPIKIGQLSRLQNLTIGCPLITSLPNSLGDLFSLTHLDISCENLEYLPTSLGKLSSLTHLNIIYCHRLKSLPTSLGDLSSLKLLDINYCKRLESLPTSLENLSSLTHLSIDSCRELKSLPTSLKNLSCLTNLLECLIISFCPIRQEDFEAGYLSSAFSNLKHMTLYGTKACRISISEGRYQRLESLSLRANFYLTEIEALPVNLACLHINGSPKLDKLPSFARLTSLRELEVERCHRIEKIEGLKYCTRLEELTLETRWEVPGIEESLERMGKLRKVKLRANKGSAIESCIQSIKNLQNWPDELIIYAQTVPDATSLVDSFKHELPPELCAVDSNKYAEQYIFSKPELHSPNGSAFMLCFVVDSLSTKDCSSFENGSVELESGLQRSSFENGDGKWALIGVFTQHSTWHGRSDFKLSDRSYYAKVKVERGLAVRGEKKRLVEALLPLCKSLWG